MSVHKENCASDRAECLLRQFEDRRFVLRSQFANKHTSVNKLNFTVQFPVWKYKRVSDPCSILDLDKVTTRLSHFTSEQIPQHFI